jgi:hypothetical protein
LTDLSGSYTIYTLNSSTGAEVKRLTGSWSGGVFTKSGTWNLDAGTYKFICSNISADNNFPSATYLLMSSDDNLEQARMSDVLTQTIVANQNNLLNFTTRHKGTGLKFKVVTNVGSPNITAATLTNTADETKYAQINFSDPGTAVLPDIWNLHNENEYGSMVAYKTGTIQDSYLPFSGSGTTFESGYKYYLPCTTSADLKLTISGTVGKVSFSNKAITFGNSVGTFLPNNRYTVKVNIKVGLDSMTYISADTNMGTVSYTIKKAVPDTAYIFKTITGGFRAYVSKCFAGDSQQILTVSATPKSTSYAFNYWEYTLDGITWTKDSGLGATFNSYFNSGNWGRTYRAVFKSLQTQGNNTENWGTSSNTGLWQ